MNTPRRYSIVWVAVAALVGCGDPEPNVSFASEIQPIFNRACVACHLNETEESAFLDLRPGQAHAGLVDVASVQHATMLRVRPGSPEESYLWHKVKATHREVGGEGEYMPYGEPFLPEEELALIEEWITSGAKNE